MPTSGKETEATPSLFVGVGVGSYKYPDRYPQLDQAVAEVKDIGQILGGHDYVAHIFEDLDAPSLIGKLSDVLEENDLAGGGSLVVLWSGHGEPAEQGGLYLVDTNKKPQSATPLTAAYLTDLAARTGANQILLVFDTCYSGGAVIEAARVASAVLQKLPPDLPHVWVGIVSSALDFERAKDGEFGKRLIKLLNHGPDDPKLRQRWTTQNKRLRGDDLMNALSREWDISGQRLKVLQVGDPDFMLQNPIYQPPSPDRMDVHLLDAARGGEPGEERSYFVGRATQLDRIVGWMKDGKPGAFVVSGPLGSGKSAIVGRIVSLSDHHERANLLATGPLGHADPGEGSVGAHVYAVRFSTEALAAAIDEQLIRHGLLAPDAGGPRSRENLLGAIQQIGKYPVIVVDGLNESSARWRIAEELLRTLSEVSLLLVGTQDLPPADGPLSLVKALGAREVIDLGDPAIQHEAEPDLRHYVEIRLADVAAPGMDVSKVADTILKLVRQQPAGAFLLTRFLTAQVRKIPVNTSLPSWEEELTHSIEKEFDDFIAGLPGLRRRDAELSHAANDLLEALAWAKGPGLTDDVWPTIATALSGTSYERSDVYWILDHAGRYIIEDGQDERAVYRLVHPWLAEHFAPVLESDQSDDRAIRVARALVSDYLERLKSGQFPQKPTYLWRYAWRHCADAGLAGIEAFRQLVAHDEDAFSPQLALALTAVSKSQSRLGMWQEASRIVQETVTIYQRLAQDDVAQKIDLAESLVAQSRLQVLEGRPNDALQAAGQAVDLLRSMDASNPAIGVAFASALAAFSLCQGQAGHLREAIAPASEAVALLRRLSTDNPAFDPELADALTAQGVGYFQGGNPNEAVNSAQDAVELFKKMDTANPAVRLGFIWALTILGLGLSQAGRPQDGVVAAKQAVDLTRTLDIDNPAIKLVFALALTALGSGYFLVGKAEQAVETASEAVGLFRGMETTNQAVNLGFAWALSTLGAGYLQAGRPQDAVIAAEEGIRLSRQMDTTNPVIRLGLASALSALAVGYFQAGRATDAVKAAKEATDLFNGMDTTNQAVGLPFASALWVLSLGYLQVEQGNEAVEAADQAVKLLETMDADNSAVRLSHASALSALGLAYGLTEQVQKSVDAASQAVKLFETLDVTKPVVQLPYASALSALGLGYLEAEQTQKAVDATKQALDLLEAMDPAKPAVRLPYASALFNLGLEYLQAEKPKDAIGPAQKAADLYRSIARVNPGFLRQLAVALTTLGQAHFQAGQLGEAANSVKDAVGIYQALALSSSASLPSLAETLGILDGYLRKAARAGESDAQWQSAVDSQEQPNNKALLLIRRAEAREPSDLMSVRDLLLAKSYLADTDEDLLLELHRVCRTLRDADPASFDAAWKNAGGGEIPDWLMLPQPYLELAAQWLDTQSVSLEAGREFLRKNIGELPAEYSSAAFDEMARFLPDPGVAELFRGLLDSAQKLGIDQAYQPFFAMRLLLQWMNSDAESTHATLQADRQDLIGDGVTDAMQTLLAQDPQNPTLQFHQQLLNLARAGKDDLAFDLMADPAKVPAKLFDLAGAGEIDVLDSLATLLYIHAETETARATPCFYIGIAAALRDNRDDAIAAVAEASRLDPTQVSNWLALLFKMPVSQRDKLVPLSDALSAPKPPKVDS